MGNELTMEAFEAMMERMRQEDQRLIRLTQDDVAVLKSLLRQAYEAADARRSGTVDKLID